MLLDYLKLMTFVLKKYKWLFLAFFILINFIMLPLCLSEISYSNVLQSDPQMLCFNFLQKNILLIMINYIYYWSYSEIYLCNNWFYNYTNDIFAIIFAYYYKNRFIYLLYNDFCVSMFNYFIFLLFYINDKFIVINWTYGNNLLFIYFYLYISKSLYWKYYSY